MSAAFILCFSYGTISYRSETPECRMDMLYVMKPVSSLRINHRNWQVMFLEDGEHRNFVKYTLDNSLRRGIPDSSVESF